MRECISEFRPELVPISGLRPHPRNYRAHPDDQLGHIIESIRANGVYRNVVIARDGTIPAGHGVVEAARRAGLDSIPAVRLDIDPSDVRAIKVMTGDNEANRLAEVDDRLLAELLKQVKDEDESGLLGTGFDEMMLANFLMVTRPVAEVRDKNAAFEWVGMPDYDEGSPTVELTVRFDGPEDRDEFLDRIGARHVKKQTERCRSIRWPDREIEDSASLRIEG